MAIKKINLFQIVKSIQLNLITLKIISFGTLKSEEAIKKFTYKKKTWRDTNVNHHGKLGKILRSRCLAKFHEFRH